MKKISILFILFLSTSFSSLAWSSENYDDCIFKNMKDIGSDVGAREIIDLCKARHINSKSSICFEVDAKTINGIIFLQDINEPYSGNNLCKYTIGQVKSKGNIKNGKLDGKSTEWFSNGEIWTEKLYIEGNLVGKTRYSYHENGEIKSKNNYKVGKQDGKQTTWYEDGQIKSEKNYTDGKRDGKQTIWYEDGQILSDRNYKDGKQDGKSIIWYENGLKWIDGNYKDGKQDGKSIEWFANGEIKSEKNYKDGMKDI